MIVLGIDPGTASLGYGLVDRTGTRLRLVDCGAFHTDADTPLPQRLLAIHGFLLDLIELHSPTFLAIERIFHSRNVQTALAVGHARGVVLLAAAAHGLEVREATPSEVKLAVTGSGTADKQQVGRMVQAILGLPEAPQPDDAADALAIAIWTANRERAGERINAGILDRAAVAPRRAGETPYERAVRDAHRPRGAGPGGGRRHRPEHGRPAHYPARHAARAPAGPSRPRRMIASVDGSIAAVGADSLVLEVGGIGYRIFVTPAVLVAAEPGRRLKLHTHHVVREDLQALYGLRTVDELGFFGLLLTVTGVGPRVALAIIGSRPVAELQLAILAGDEAILTSISGVGKRLAGRVILELKEKVAASGTAAGVAGAAGSAGGTAGPTEGDVVAALQALGYSLAEAREASRAAGEPAPGGTLEDRVKAALRGISAGVG